MGNLAHRYIEKKSKFNYYLFWTFSYIFVWLRDLSGSYINFVCFFGLFNLMASHNLTVHLIDFATIICNGTGGFVFDTRRT